jgi:hypothetical protein
MANIAKRAAAGAFVPHDHEGSRAFAKTFSDVGAGGFFTHRVELAVPQDLLDLVKMRGGRPCLDANPLGFLECGGLLHLDRDAAQLGSGLLLGAGVVVGLGLRFVYGRVG